jgi:hypothetical protein
MLKKISKRHEIVSNETMNSTKGGLPNPVACAFQCADDCAWDAEISVGTGAFTDAFNEIELPF